MNSSAHGRVTIPYVLRSRWRIAFLAVLALVLTEHFSGPIFFNYALTNWPAAGRQIDSTRSVIIQEKFMELTEPVLDVIDQLKLPSLEGTTPEDTLAWKKSLFVTLKQARSKPSLAITVFDLEKRVLAYVGQSMVMDTARFRRSFYRETAALFVAPHEIIFTVWKPVDTKPKLILMAGIPVSRTYPLQNRMLMPSGLKADIQRSLGLELHVLAKTKTIDDPSLVSFPLYDKEAHLVGSATIPAETVDEYAMFLRTNLRKVRVFLLLFLLFLPATVLLKKGWIESRRSAAWLILTIFVLWNVRWALFKTDALNIFLPDSFNDPTLFASSFAWGFVSSLPALILSLLCLLFSVIALFRFALESEVKTSRWITPGLFLLAGFIVPLILRGTAASLRSFVYDSSLPLGGLDSLLAEPAVFSLLIAGGMLCIAAVLGFLAIVFMLRRQSALFPTMMGRLALLVVAIAGFGFYCLLTRSPLLPESIYYFTFALFLALILLPGFERVLAPRWFLAAGLSLGASVLFAPILHYFLNEYRMGTVEISAREEIQPIDSWTMLLLRQSMDQIAQASVLREADLDANAIFEAWAQSPLSRHRVNFIIGCFDSSNRPVTRFGIGISTSILIQAHESALPGRPPITITSTQPQLGSFKYAAMSAVVNKSNIITIVIEFPDRARNQTLTTELLRNTQSPASLLPEDQFIYSWFENGHLVSSNNSDTHIGSALPAAITEVLATSNETWGNLVIGKDLTPTFFRTSGTGNRILAVSIPPGDFLFDAYRTIRYSFITVIITVFVVLILFPGKWKSVRVRLETFHSRLALAFLLIAVVPLSILWVNSNALVREQAESNSKRTLKARLLDFNRYIHSSLGNHPTLPSADSLLRSLQPLGKMAGMELNLYSGLELAASTRQELYDTRLLDPRLPSAVYEAMYIEGRSFVVTRETIGSFSYLVGYIAVRHPDGSIEAILSSPTLYEHYTLEAGAIRSSTTIMLWGIGVLIIVFLLSFGISRTIALPIRRLTKATREVASGHLRPIPSISGSREVTDLVATFNAMIEELKTSRENLARAERLVAWQRMARQVAHEIRNPLTPMKLAAQHLRQAARDKKENLEELIDKITTTIIEQVESLSAIAEEFASFGRMPSRDYTPVNIVEILRNVIDLHRQGTGIRFELDVSTDKPLYVNGDIHELQRVFTNIIRNSIQALHPSEIPDPTVTVSVAKRANEVLITIVDNGPGIPEDLLPRIFEPNFSTKTHGMGLGLPIVQKIISDMGGTVNITSEEGEGTQVHIAVKAVSP